MSVSAVHASPASRALREGAAEDPSRVALEIDERQISYGDLNAQADRLAQRLVGEFGGGSDRRIAVRALGTHELAVGFLGVQRAGMVTVPIDPTAPPERVQIILDDVEPSSMLSDVEGDEAFSPAVPVFNPLTFGAEMDAVAIDCERGELVSIVYTSGSTGTPKGIMIGREQVNRMLVQLVRFPAGSRFGGLVAGTVNQVETQIIMALSMRATFVSYEIRRRGLAGLGSWLESSAVVFVWIVPTVLRYVLSTLSPEHQFSSLRSLQLGGETGTWEDVAGLRPHLHPDAVIINPLAMTETYGLARLTITSDMPLGKGPLPGGIVLPGVDVAIIDPNGQPVPTGQRGEIVVRGKGVAVGYWRRPELTRAVFRELEDGCREVRTGDAGRLGADGMLEHLGRIDHMVKISGNRVELEEVEHALTSLEGVATAGVAAYADDTQTTRLAACVVRARDAPLDPRALRASLSRQLPGYMIPHRIAIVDELPRLPGGKLDRAQVPELAVTAAVQKETPPGASELERSLQDIWQDILQVDHVDRNDDFFLVGGDSMCAHRMFIELDRRLGIDRPVSLLAEAPTIASLASMFDDEESAWDAPVAFRTEGTQPPLFVVHDGSGAVLNGRGLARELTTDQPIYGLRAKGMSGHPPEEKSLPELAANYVRKIQALYPNGPYLLYGVSLGGTLSLEMARQLIEAGESVPFVAMGDTFAPRPPSELFLRVLPIIPSARARRHLVHLRDLNTADRVDHLLALVRRVVVRRARGEISAARAENVLLDRAIERGERIPVSVRPGYARRVYARIGAGYEPHPPYPERVLLLRTGGPGRRPDRGWGPLLGDRLEIVDVPGSHPELGFDASGPYVAPVLARTLNEVLA